MKYKKCHGSCKCTEIVEKQKDGTLIRKGNYKIECTTCGLEIEDAAFIYHKTNPKIKMIIAYVFDDRIRCRWVDTIGNYHVQEMSLYELELY